MQLVTRHEETCEQNHQKKKEKEKQGDCYLTQLIIELRFSSDR